MWTFEVTTDQKQASPAISARNTYDEDMFQYQAYLHTPWLRLMQQFTSYCLPIPYSSLIITEVNPHAALLNHLLQWGNLGQPIPSPYPLFKMAEQCIPYLIDSLTHGEAYMICPCSSYDTVDRELQGISRLLNSHIPKSLARDSIQ